MLKFFDLQEIANSLPLEQIVPSLDPDLKSPFGDEGNSTIALSRDLIVHIRNAALSTPFTCRVKRDGFITIQIALSGRATSRNQNLQFRIPGKSIRINNFPESDITFDGQRGRDVGVTIFVTRGALIEKFGLDVTRLNDIGSAIMNDDPTTLASLALPLLPEILVEAENLVYCEMSGRTKVAYIDAHTWIILCRIVSLLQRTAAEPRSAHVSREEVARRAIHAAAQIYVREVTTAPSVAEVAKRVGLNRNKLSAGFLTIYGMTPAAFSRTQKLEWAKARLGQGAAISVVAAEVGYEPAAFSRAFRKQFGHLPSELT